MRIVESVRKNGSKRVQMFCDDESLTRQEFKDECDLEKVIKRFSKTREGREALKNAQGFIGGRFEDVSNVPDYREALELIHRADEAFMSLPPEVRTKFDNDAAKFIDFVDDPKNLGELQQMGLVQPMPVGDVKKTEAPVVKKEG